MKRVVPVVALLGFALFSRADGPADNLPDMVRRIPPPGIAIPAADRTELQSSTELLGRAIESLRETLKGKPALLDLLPDVQIFYNAARYALQYDEFYDVREVAAARKLLNLGMERIQQLKDGKPTWTTATGLVVRGYVSKIDGSVQPYGLVVPSTYQPNFPHKYRLDFWCHGRGEKLTELSFLDSRLKSPGEFTPPNAFVLHLYGRYCCANKFAGEVDLFEAYDSVRKHYPIDENRLVIRGFSMGGAACWQFAVHYPGMWAAAAPGAGFSETQEFLKVFQNEPIKPTAYEQKLWHLYDCTDYAVNLFNCPTVAYSGENDRQKQAADIMAKALLAQDMELTHIIGPKTEHRYHPESKIEINRRVDAIAAKGRDVCPLHVKFTTWTLRYNRSHWVVVEEMEKHWEQATVDAHLGSGLGINLLVKTQNIAALTLDIPPGELPVGAFPQLGREARPPWLVVPLMIDNQQPFSLKPKTDRSLRVHLRKHPNGNWAIVSTLENSSLRKRHGLQGPIDDAFWDKFVMVRPTGKANNEKVSAWVDAELKHATEHWRRQFRGEAPVKDDTAITDADIASSNLILWGDPTSNAILAKIADKLPIRWDAQNVQLGERSFPASQHVPVLIYPNPLNPKRYVVLNSGFTFREYDYLNNARQVPKLPDYAVVDIFSPVTSRFPGRIVEAGFFTDDWTLPGKRP